MGAGCVQEAAPSGDIRLMERVDHEGECRTAAVIINYAGVATRAKTRTRWWREEKGEACKKLKREQRNGLASASARLHTHGNQRGRGSLDAVSVRDVEGEGRKVGGRESVVEVGEESEGGRRVSCW
jgi:hypothetical protein